METSGSHFGADMNGCLSMAEKANLGLDISSFRKRMESRLKKVLILKGDAVTEADVETKKTSRENNSRS